MCCKANCADQDGGHTYYEYVHSYTVGVTSVSGRVFAPGWIECSSLAPSVLDRSAAGTTVEAARRRLGPHLEGKVERPQCGAYTFFDNRVVEGAFEHLRNREI